MKFLMKLFSRCGFLLLKAFPILVYSQIFPSLNAHQKTDLGTKIAHGGDFTPSSEDFRTEQASIFKKYTGYFHSNIVRVACTMEVLADVV